jgi:hypothetical protein
MTKYIDVVFDGPPDHESGRFVEAEDDQGRSLSLPWHQAAQLGAGACVPSEADDVT